MSFSLRRPEDEIFKAMLDNRFFLSVYHQGGYKADLYLFDHKHSGSKAIWHKKVNVLYGADLAPEFEDIIEWIEMAKKFIDEDYYCGN